MFWSAAFQQLQLQGLMSKPQQTNILNFLKAIFKVLKTFTIQ